MQNTAYFGSGNIFLTGNLDIDILNVKDPFGLLEENKI